MPEPRFRPARRRNGWKCWKVEMAWISLCVCCRVIAKYCLAAVSDAANGLYVVGALIGVPFIALSPSPFHHYSLDQLDPQVARTLVVLTADGRPFARRGGCVDRPVKLSEVPQHFIDALLSMEDRRFYSHFGVDPLGIARAAYRNWKAGQIVEGGSTITQQLVKFSFLSSNRTIDRKRSEILLAAWLELMLTKDQILERYLSSAYLGDGCFGLRAATRHYFGKPVAALTLPESALLVALLKSPTSLNVDRKGAQERTRLVLRAMVDNGRLSASRLSEIGWVGPRIEQKNPFGAYYADWLASRVRVPTGDYTPAVLHSFFEPRLQRSAEKAIESVLGKQGKRRHATQAALVAMRTDGRVVAMVGGRDYGKSQFNRAVQALRQPGSSFKLFVYLAALRAGASPDMTVPDEPFSIGNYEPRNFGESYRGEVSLRDAFASSINTVAVRLSESVGRNHVIAAARDLGITTPLDATPSLALGAWEVNLLELTSAYAAVAAGAYPVKPWGIKSLDDSSDATTEPTHGSGRWRLTVSNELRELLEGAVRYGSGRGARLPITTFGKTGTSQEFRDAWFLGFAGNLVVGVWVGNDDNSPMKNVTGSSFPAQIWRTFMMDALRSDPNFKRKLPHIAAFERQIPEQRRRRRAAFELLDSGSYSRSWTYR
ncbi:MAG: penicillin-binding protein [Rhizobiales bacterium]|nr:penicillin-binding protein [Hyphomicrobiales bacterium]